MNYFKYLLPWAFACYLALKTYTLARKSKLTLQLPTLIEYIEAHEFKLKLLQHAKQRNLQKDM